MNILINSKPSLLKRLNDSISYSKKLIFDPPYYIDSNTTELLKGISITASTLDIKCSITALRLLRQGLLRETADKMGKFKVNISAMFDN